MRAASTGIAFDEKMLESVLREIYHEEVVPSEGGISKRLYEATRDIFERATAQGMAQSRNKRIVEEEDFLRKYTHSIEVFSAFRAHRYGEMMASKLHDDEGNLLPFEEWRKATASIQSHFNRSWLETEYSTAILRAQQAADWKGFERDKGISPNLTWMPTSSADPREAHAVFWRDALTLPVDDPFWDEHRPGDLWNCKCWLKQTDAPATPGKDVPNGKDVPKPDKGLEQNPGKTAEMFSSKQPHYPNPKTCIWLKLAGGKAKNRMGRFFDAAKCIGNCNNCDLMLKLKENKSSGPTISRVDAEKAQTTLREAYDKWTKEGKGCPLPILKIGEIQSEVSAFLRNKGIIVESESIVISPKELTHMLRRLKVELGKAVDIDVICDFVEDMRSYNAVYDGVHKNFILFKYRENDIVKFVIQPNKELKGCGKVNATVTAGKIVDKPSFWSNGYELIK